MTVTLELPPETEAQMREAAVNEGVDLSTFLREAAEARLQRSRPAPPSTEDELLEKINKGLPEAFWTQFHRLSARRRAETLTRKEQTELIKLSDQMEARRAERLEALVELSRLRGTTLDALMDELGLRPDRRE